MKECDKLKGLTDAEVIVSRKKYGSNSINVKKQNKFLRLFIETLGDPIIKIMLIALAIRVIFMFKEADWYETIGMLISILLSSLISSLSEYGSNKAFERLQSEYEKIMVRVLRNGNIISLSNQDIVVDDIIYLSSGEIVPADAIILEGSLGVDESSINGEAEEVIKNLNDLVLKGSVVLSKSATLKVKAVGINTVYGDIAKELTEKEPDSPMKIRLRKLASVISKIGYIGAILAVIAYFFNDIVLKNDFDMNVIIELLKSPNYIIDHLIHGVTLAVTIIIVCVPEGLPMMVALVLSSNMKRLLKNNVLVRKLVGIETSGSLNVLLTDKTGTLTKGKLEVIGVVDVNDFKYNSISEMKDIYKEKLINALNYNNESIYEGDKIIGGNSTDKAILKYIGQIEKKKKIIKRIDFDSKNKYSFVELEGGTKYYKGALEVLINKCTYFINKDGEKKIVRDIKILKNIIRKYTSRGIRVITILEEDILLGFVLIRDDVREEALESLEMIKNAGIDVIMITGDDASTASAIATELGLVSKDDYVITHDDLVKMSDEEILKYYKRIKVIARALPKDKSRIASVLEMNGLVVGMTGDGVNDAPALKKANVGFAMGSGSEVAKEASDIVILDDNIKSICNAILYGRTIFKSIRKFIIFQLTMNFCALALSVVGPFIGVSSPVTVMQMLWINMIMDTLAGLAFSYEAPMKRYMKEKPIKKSEPILNKYMYITIIYIALISTVILILFLKLDLVHLFIRCDYNHEMTAFFSLFIFISIFNAFNARTTRLNIFSNILKNRVFIIIFVLIFLAQIYLIYFGGTLFRTFGLLPIELATTILLASLIIPIDLIKKYYLKKHLLDL